MKIANLKERINDEESYQQWLNEQPDDWKDK